MDWPHNKIERHFFTLRPNLNFKFRPNHVCICLHDNDNKASHRIMTVKEHSLK